MSVMSQQVCKICGAAIGVVHDGNVSEAIQEDMIQHQKFHDLLATLREEVLVLQNDRIDNRCTKLKKELFEVSAELEEAQSEIARHHELITWMRDSLFWATHALNDESDWSGDHKERIQEIWTRLNREVS